MKRDYGKYLMSLTVKFLQMIFAVQAVILKILSNPDNFSDIFGRKQELPNEEISVERLIRDIAVRQLFKPQCMRMANLNDKIEEINKNIVKNKIKGIIYISQKFCDNTLLFYPLLREKLNEKNIPSLFIEIEHNNLSVGQIKTRIQAFLEII